MKNNRLLAGKALCGHGNGVAVDCVKDGVIADDLFICVGVFVHHVAEDDVKIQSYNYQAARQAIYRALNDAAAGKMQPISMVNQGKE